MPEALNHGGQVCAGTAAVGVERGRGHLLWFGNQNAEGPLSISASVVHGSASEFWKVLEQFELFSLTVSQA